MAQIPEPKWNEIVLARIVLRDADRGQQIYLTERDGKRGFPMVIGRAEADEIQRIVSGIESPRPFTHQLAHGLVEALGGQIVRAQIVDLREGTFYAQLVLHDTGSSRAVLVDARPSDAIALALRAHASIHVAEFVLEQVRTDESGPDPLPEAEDTGPE